MIKYFLSIWLCLGFTGLLNAQSVGIGVENANNNAVLELVSPNNDQGFLVPRLTTAQRTNTTFLSKLSPTDNGLLVFDSNESTFYYWQTDQWLPIRYGADQDPDPTNEIQDLSLSGNILTITGNSTATPIDLSPFSGTDTDQQRIDIFQLTGTVLELSLERDNESTRGIDLSVINSDNQGLLLNGNNLTIENGTGSVDLSAYINDADADPANELQTLSKTNGVVSLSRNGGSFTDDVGLLTVAVNATLTGNGTASLPLDLADGAVSTSKLVDNAVTGAKVADGSLTDMDISSLGWGKITGIPADIADGDQVNDADADPANELQTVTLLKNVVTLSGNGGSFSIDDLDADPANELQTASKVGTTVTLSGSGSSFTVDDADASPTNELQTASKVGTTVTLSGSGSSFTVDDADASATNELQTLSQVGTTVSLSGNGGSVDVRDFQPYAFKATISRFVDLQPGVTVIPFDQVLYDITRSYDPTTYTFTVKDAGIYNFQGLITLSQEIRSTAPYHLRLTDLSTKKLLYDQLVTTSATSTPFTVDVYLPAGAAVQFDFQNDDPQGALMRTTELFSEATIFISARRIN